MYLFWQLGLEATTKGQFSGDIAVDSFSMTSGACQSEYHCNSDCNIRQVILLFSYVGILGEFTCVGHHNLHPICPQQCVEMCHTPSNLTLHWWCEWKVPESVNLSYSLLSPTLSRKLCSHQMRRAKTRFGASENNLRFMWIKVRFPFLPSLSPQRQIANQIRHFPSWSNWKVSWKFAFFAAAGKTNFVSIYLAWRHNTFNTSALCRFQWKGASFQNEQPNFVTFSVWLKHNKVVLLVEKKIHQPQFSISCLYFAPHERIFWTKTTPLSCQLNFSESDRTVRRKCRKNAKQIPSCRPNGLESWAINGLVSTNSSVLRPEDTQLSPDAIFCTLILIGLSGISPSFGRPGHDFVQKLWTLFGTF